MEDQLSLPLAPVTTRRYQPRGINSLQRLLKEHFQSLADRYEARHAIIYGRFRIERITEVVEKFILCGDYSRGIARIQCTNPDCGLSLRAAAFRVGCPTPLDSERFRLKRPPFETGIDPDCPA